MKNEDDVLQINSMVDMLSHKQLGFVLASNLIMMLLLTLIATALFKNALNETQMANLYHLQLTTKNEAKQEIITITTQLNSKVINNTDFSISTQGFYPQHQPMLLSDVNWSVNSKLLSANAQVKYVVNYLGKYNKLTAPNLGIKYHLFKVFIYNKAAKGSEYVEQVFISVEAN